METIHTLLVKHEQIITTGYANSFFKNSEIKVATARAGNVIGGGDMSQDRLVPDYLEPIIKIKKSLFVILWRLGRGNMLLNVAVLKLAEMLSLKDGLKYTGSWNFGPSGDPVAVGDVIKILSKITGGKTYKLTKASNPFLTQSLMLDSVKARKSLIGDPNFR